MPLDPEVLAELVVETIDRALAPMRGQVAALEVKVATAIPAAGAIEADDLVATFAGLLLNELADLHRPAMQKRIVRDTHGQIERVIEEPAA